MATAKEVFDDLRKDLRLLTGNRMLRALASDTWARTQERIFTKGQFSSGKTKPPYSTKPMYVPAVGVAKLQPPIGKDGKLKFKNGKKHTTRYFADGYAGLKEKLGRPNPFDLTGQLKKSYSYSVGTADAVIGFVNTKRLALNRKSSVLFTTNGDIASGLEEHYGEPIWDLTQAESKAIDEMIKLQLDQIIT